MRFSTTGMTVVCTNILQGPKFAICLLHRDYAKSRQPKLQKWFSMYDDSVNIDDYQL